MRINRATLVGITGNIGSGKSTFCKYLEASGCCVLYADKLAEKHLFSLKNRLVSRWGEEIMEYGELSKKAIAKIVFQNADERKWLNSQVHPLVLKVFQAESEAQTKGELYFEIPLLFEAGLAEAFDWVVLIRSSLENRLQRVQKRDHSSEEEILNRLNAQMPESQKALWADESISNDGNLKDLENAARQLHQRALSLNHRAVKAFTEV